MEKNFDNRGIGDIQYATLKKWKQTHEDWMNIPYSYKTVCDEIEKREKSNNQNRDSQSESRTDTITT